MRYALAVEYNGAPFSGWQRQKHSRSVQEVLEVALGRVADHPIIIAAAGRTDAGVHANAQIVHFDTSVERLDKAWVLGTNSHLPAAVSVHWASQVSDDFHARYKAVSRRYRYTILNRKARPGLGAEYLAWVNQPLDEHRMHHAAQQLLGNHDFSAFRSAQCQASHANRNLLDVAVSRVEDRVFIDVLGNAFLHNMVRIIAGTLIKIGRGERPTEWVKDLLESGDRTKAGATAAAAGLCFVQANYPPEFGVPDFSLSSQIFR